MQSIAENIVCFGNIAKKQKQNNSKNNNNKKKTRRIAVVMQNNHEFMQSIVKNILENKWGEKQEISQFSTKYL